MLYFSPQTDSFDVNSVDEQLVLDESNHRIHCRIYYQLLFATSIQTEQRLHQEISEQDLCHQSVHTSQRFKRKMCIDMALLRGRTESSKVDRAQIIKSAYKHNSRFQNYIYNMYALCVDVHRKDVSSNMYRNQPLTTKRDTIQDFRSSDLTFAQYMFSMSLLRENNNFEPIILYLRFYA